MSKAWIVPKSSLLGFDEQNNDQYFEKDNIDDNLSICQNRLSTLLILVPDGIDWRFSFLHPPVSSSTKIKHYLSVVIKIYDTFRVIVCYFYLIDIFITVIAKQPNHQNEVKFSTREHCTTVHAQKEVWQL